MTQENTKPENWQDLSKRKKRQWKKEQKKLKKEKEQRKSLLVKWGFILGAIVLLGGSFFLFKNLKTKQYENAPKIQSTPALYNFDKISAVQGKVETSFEIKNTGISELVISGMETSCGCTTAVLVNNDQTSPSFGMHNNPTNWSTSIAPEKTAKLIVNFDPNFHENAYGSITRTIAIFSNDPREAKAIITIIADVEK